MSQATIEPRITRSRPSLAEFAPGLADEIRRSLELASDLSAVDRFAQWHGRAATSVHEPLYRELMPASPPGPGEQYAFEVNLDVCSGCKACVAACHSQNGLDDGESWRVAGSLLGVEEATHITVTSSCHHCADPGCAAGCPTLAYEKDAKTGIVHHLDDQCMGCQYCLWTCPSSDDYCQMGCRWSGTAQGQQEFALLDVCLTEACGEDYGWECGMPALSGVCEEFSSQCQ